MPHGPGYGDLGGGPGSPDFGTEGQAEEELLAARKQSGQAGPYYGFERDHPQPAPKPFVSRYPRGWDGANPRFDLKADNSNGSYMWNLDAGFRQRLQALVKASGGRVTLLSGYRSNEHQQRLYDAAIKKYGAANAGKWVAAPGRSNHNHGLAGDLQFVNDAAKAWAHANASKFGLEFPMSWEPWHIEPAGLHKGAFNTVAFTADRGAYTQFDGQLHPADEEASFQNYDDVMKKALLAGPDSESFGPNARLGGEESISDA